MINNIDDGWLIALVVLIAGYFLYHQYTMLIYCRKAKQEATERFIDRLSDQVLRYVRERRVVAIIHLRPEKVPNFIKALREKGISLDPGSESTPGTSTGCGVITLCIHSEDESQNFQPDGVVIRPHLVNHKQRITRVRIISTWQ